MAQVVSIRAEALSVKKDATAILRNLTFEIKTGSITGLIGPSGSGKTTLMRSIVGLQKITGTLTVLGKSAGDTTLRRSVGYVTQAPAVYDDLTVLQNMRYFAALVGANSHKIEETISLVHLDAKRIQLVKKLSGGEKARVPLAIALLGDPELLVLDEPTVGLDPVLRQELWDLFVKLAQQGRTLIVSSHIMDEADRCESVLLLRDGELLWHTGRSELLRRTSTRSVESAFLKIVEEGRA